MKKTKKLDMDVLSTVTEPIRYLPLSDLAISLYIENSKELLSQVLKKGYVPDINDIISVFNILRYMEDGLNKELGNPDQETLMNFIVEFCKLYSCTSILNYFSQLSVWLDNDFWQFFVSFGLWKKIEEEDFSAFLIRQKPSIHPILTQKPLRNNFRLSLREYFLSNIQNVSYLINQEKMRYLPQDITSEDWNTLLSSYVHSEKPSHSDLEILSKLKDVPPRIRLAAQKRSEEVIAEVFDSSNTFTYGVKLSYQEQLEVITEKFENGTIEYCYDINWIRSNTDNATLLNNFIHLFSYIDEQARLTLCFQVSEQGVMEGLLSTRRSDWYPASIAFMQKNQAALLQLQSYSSILNSIDKSVEELINWFFKDYISNEFEINNFQVDIPEGERPFFEKCKLLASEFERILRQFQLLVEDGYIDHELMAIETHPFALSATGSLLEQKYCYLKSKDGKSASYYFYSDQCMLHYDSRIQKSYESFTNRLAQQQLCREDFEEYQHADIEWLENEGYIHFDNNNNLIPNIDKIVILGDIFRNDCLCYHNYVGSRKDVLDLMIEDGTIGVESSLFSQTEAEYIDYHLNKRRHINSLDLRNIYAHGSHTVSKDGDFEHEVNYYQMLKILVCVVLKINDELCQIAKLTTQPKLAL